MFEDLFSTPNIEQLNLDEAIQKQFQIVDTIQRHFGSDRLSKGGDFGQVNTLGQIGGGRPEATSLAERVIADIFGAEDCALVWGAGTGAIQLGLMNLAVETKQLIINDAPTYKTTEQLLRALGFSVAWVNFENVPQVLAKIEELPQAAVYIQHIPQRPGEQYEPRSFISEVKTAHPDTKIYVDDNYAVFRARHIGVEMGADVSMFSFFKTLGPDGVGCVLGPRDWMKNLRKFISSAGCQIQGPTALEVLRAIVLAPVALAIQNKTVNETADRINELIHTGVHPWAEWVVRAGGIQASHKNIVLQLKKPFANRLLQLVWEQGGNSYPIGEESRYDVTPMFYRLSSNYLKSNPDLEQYTIRINPFRSGPDTILSLLERALHLL